MTIDVHVHIGSFPSVEGAGKHLTTRPDVAAFRTRHPDLYARFVEEDPVDNSGILVAMMDRYGVDRSLIQPRPGISNEFVQQLAAANPERLVPLALPTPWPTPADPEGAWDGADLGRRAADTLRHCFDTLGMRAAGEVYVRRITHEIHPERIADDLAPVMEILHNHGAPLEIPTAWTQFPGGLYYGDPIWVDEIATRYPDVPIILTKMGRGLQRYFEASLVVALRNANVYFDTSDTTPAHLSTALELLGPERILFGTDWSATWQFMTTPGSVHQIALDTVAAATSDVGVRKQITGRTAEMIFANALS